MYNLKTDYPCNLKLWFMYFFAIFFPFMQKISLKKVECHFNGCLPKNITVSYIYLFIYLK